MSGDHRVGERAIELSFDTSLAAPMNAVWARVSTFAGINAELAPLVKMTFPPPLRADGYDSETGLEEIVAESRLRSPEALEHSDSAAGLRGAAESRQVRCWLLAAGFLPFDRHSFRLERVIEDPTMRGFDEESTSWLQRRWRHERRVIALDDSTCRVTDRLTVVPRPVLVASLVAPIVRAVFGHRHRRLVREFGASGVSDCE